MIGTALYPKYVEGLKKGINKYRWYEYALSSSVMIWVISMLVGIYDVAKLSGSEMIPGNWGKVESGWLVQPL
jgi:hypothetical protein